MAIRADITLPREFRIGGWELIIKTELSVVTGPAQNSLSPEPRVECDVECSEIEARPTAVEKERVGDAAVVLLGQPVYIAVRLCQVMAIRLVEMIERALGLALGEQQWFTLGINDHGISSPLDPDLTGVGLTGDIDPYRVAHVLVGADNSFEIGHHEFLLKLRAGPEDASWIGLLFGRIELAIVNFPVALVELAWAMAFGWRGATRSVEIGFPLPNVLCELALAVPIRETRGVDCID